MRNRSLTTNRRRIVMTSAGLLAGGLGLAAYSQRGRAEIVLDQLSIPSSQFQSADGQPAHIWLFVDAMYQYKVSTTPASVMVALYHRDTGGGFNSLAEWTKPTTATSDGRTVSLKGDLIASDAYSPSDFDAPGAGQSKTVTTELGVLLQVLASDGSVIRDASIEKAVDFQITEEAVSASVGGEGQAVYQDDDSDPSPTPPP